MKKEIFIIFLFLFLFSFVYAVDTESLGTFEKGKTIELMQSGDNGTALLEFCNITSIKYPNSSIIISDILQLI